MNAESVSKHSLGTCAILGASGHGKVVAEIAELNGYSDIHFYDDRWPELRNIEHWNIVGDTEALLASVQQYACVAVAIGNNAIRLNKHKQLLEVGARMPSLVHPNAVISGYATIAEGCVVMANAVVNPFAVLGQTCIVNTGAVIEHDCHLAHGVHLSPNSAIAGGTQIGECAWLGIGAVTRQLVSVGAGATIGAGATVIGNVDANTVVMGTPAKIQTTKDLGARS
ncbi:acetyltransferase [Vibrio vulnificus]|nr:acetyltransferase [Vibrio vulnificus]EIO3937749.1 acetyltransferase [Vibrio vulnificus]EKZ9056034.1 acetyltransferase [Vibrio vulnificus]ELY5143588.1 acetyltransferase [Vibrio vulnificus]MCA0779098.1 acetyltransferase [Vibrio vulnificus]MCU8115772.1 acetyltransferase [Vibrio vulnificus]